MLTNNSQCYRVMIAFIDIRKTLLFRMVESEGTKMSDSEGADLSDADM